MMLAWLAAADRPRGSVPVDWLPILAPLAAIVAAVIAATVARRNVRKAPHEQLETLIQLYRDWPDELEGRGTIERQISLQLAELRVASDDAGQPDASSVEHAAEQRVLARARRLLLNRTLAWVLVGGSLVYSLIVSFFYPDHYPYWAYVSGMTALITGGTIYFLSYTPLLFAVLRRRRGSAGSSSQHD